MAHTENTTRYYYGDPIPSQTYYTYPTPSTPTDPKLLEVLERIADALEEIAYS